jgi:hypothetical protein
MLKANHVVGHGFTLNQIKQDYEIGICNFSAKHAAFRVWIMVVVLLPISFFLLASPPI